MNALGLPVARRDGGAIDEHALIQAIQADDESMLGRNKLFEAGLVEEDDNGVSSEVGKKAKFFIVDFVDEILAFCREYDSAADDVETFLPFDADHIYALPMLWGFLRRFRIGQLRLVVILSPTTEQEEDVESSPFPKRRPKRPKGPKAQEDK